MFLVSSFPCTAGLPEKAQESWEFLFSIWLLATLSHPHLRLLPSAAGSVTQPQELRGELIGGGGRKSQGRENQTNQRGWSPRRRSVGPRLAHNSSSSSPCVKAKRCFNGSVGRGKTRERGIENQKRERERCKSKCRCVDRVRRACWLTGWFIGFFQLITAGLWPNGSPAKLKGSRGKQAYKHKAA